jgi:hypothetical protein
MVPRRQMLQSGAVGGILGLLAPAGAAAEARSAAQPAERLSLDAAVAAIDRLRADLHAERTFSDIGQIREAQKTFLRTNGKLPDFMEVGMDLWFAVYDWHVRWQQPLSLGRDVNGRYTIALLQTLVVLRTETAANFMSPPY